MYTIKPCDHNSSQGLLGGLIKKQGGGYIWGPHIHNDLQVVWKAFQNEMVLQ